jgi:hypothetical protein
MVDILGELKSTLEGQDVTEVVKEGLIYTSNVFNETLKKGTITSTPIPTDLVLVYPHLECS